MTQFLLEYKWIIGAFVLAVSLTIATIIKRWMNRNSDLAVRFSSSEEKAEVSTDLLGRHISVRPAQFVFDGPEKFYPYIANKFGRHVITHQFKNSHKAIKFIFEKFPDAISLNENDIKPLMVKFGIAGDKSPVILKTGENFSNLRNIGTQGTGKTNVSKILVQQVCYSFNVIVLSTKISDFSDFKGRIGIELLNPNKDDELHRFFQITNELKDKILKEENCRTWIVLDEAIKDLAVHGWEKKKPREKLKQDIVDNINFFLSLGRKFKLFLLVNTQDENIKNEAGLDLARIGNVISGRISNQASADLYGIPFAIAQRRDLTNGKLIFATQDNRQCFVFKSYLFKKEVKK